MKVSENCINISLQTVPLISVVTFKLSCISTNCEIHSVTE